MPPAAGERRLVSLVIPFFNEERAVVPLFERLGPVLDAMPGYRFEIVCVDDGSTDVTVGALHAAAALRPGVVVVELSRNFGKEAALSAGLGVATGDAVIPLDADLQDPPELVGEMLARWRRATRSCSPAAATAGRTPQPSAWQRAPSTG